jgi:hypothetical protein
MTSYNLSKLFKSEKYRPQETASNKLEIGPIRDYETAFCLPVLEKKILKI